MQVIAMTQNRSFKRTLSTSCKLDSDKFNSRFSAAPFLVVIKSAGLNRDFIQVIEKTHPIKKFFSKTSSDDFLEENTEDNAGNFNEAVSGNPDVVCDPDLNQQSFSEIINTDLLLDVTGSFLSSFDIGNFKPQNPGEVKVFLSHDHKIPNDVFNQKFPNHLLSKVLPSGQNV